MNRLMGKTIVGGALVLVGVLGAAGQIQAQDAKDPYPRMAPIEQYLMERNAEIALARTAAPAAISGDAEVWVLGRKGYETAVHGKNGFVCLVDRSWSAPADNLEFWNPKNRSPVCYNPPAARSILPPKAKRTELILSGMPKAQALEVMKTAYDKKELPSPEPGSMAYMMSKEAYLTDQGGHNIAHVMFEVPRMAGAALGADLPGSPVSVLNPNETEPMTEFIVPVRRWSDGTLVTPPASPASDAHKH